MLSNANNSLAGFITPIKNHDALTYVISNFRKVFNKLGFDASLLTDQEVLALEDHVFDYENEEDPEWLLDTLNGMSVNELDLAPLIGVNLEHKLYGLKRVNIKNYSEAIERIRYVRVALTQVGYSCGLLTDSEVLAFSPALDTVDHSKGIDELVKMLDFFKDRIV